AQDPQPPPAQPPPAQPPQGQPQGQPPPAQPPQGQPPSPGQGVDVLLDERVQQLQGKTIRSIRVLQIDAQGRLQPMMADDADALVRGLLLRVGQPFEARKARDDNESLWH